MHCMLMDLLHGFEVLSTTEETLFNSRNAAKVFMWGVIFPVILLQGYKAMSR